MTRELESYLNNSNAGEMLWEIAVSLEILKERIVNVLNYVITMNLAVLLQDQDAKGLIFFQVSECFTVPDNA